MVKNEPVLIKNDKPDFPKTHISEQNCSEFAYTEQTFDDEIDATVKNDETEAKEDASYPTEAQVARWRQMFFYHKKWMKVTEDRAQKFAEDFQPLLEMLEYLQISCE